MSTIVVKSDNQANLVVSGTLDFNSVTDLFAKGQSLMDVDHNYQVDLANTTRCDSSGLVLLVSWLRFAKQKGVSLTFINVPNQLFALAQVSGLHEILSLT